MAKKKTIQDGIVEETTVDAEVEAPVIPREEDEGVVIEQLKAEPIYVPQADDPELNVTFTLPRAVLMALIDHTHPDASEFGASYFGLLTPAGLTPIGEKVLAGCDQTALRHQMAMAWRTAYNAALEPSKMGRP